MTYRVLVEFELYTFYLEHRDEWTTKRTGDRTECS